MFKMQRCTTYSHEARLPAKYPPELGAFIHAIKEELLVLVLEGEVEGLDGEIHDDIRKVVSAEGE